jgi:polyisoprenoid-binding protein YceI
MRHLGCAPAGASPQGVTGRLKNSNVGFHNSPGPRSKRLETTGIFFQQNLCASLTAVVTQVMPVPLLLILALFVGCPEPLSAQVSGSYRVNPKESKIEIHLFKGGLLGSLGDNHLIALTRFTGKANLSQTDGWRAELSGDADSLTVIDPWGNPTERKEVQDTMLGPDQVDASHFPSIELHSLSFDPVDHDTVWNLVANVKLHGVTRKVQFSLDCHENGDKLQIQGKKMFKLTDFDIQPYSTGFGTVKIKNDFLVTYNVVLDRIH